MDSATLEINKFYKSQEIEHQVSDPYNPENRKIQRDIQTVKESCDNLREEPAEEDLVRGN